MKTVLKKVKEDSKAIKEYGGKEVYKNAKQKKMHEGKETKSMEKKEKGATMKSNKK